MPAAAAAHTEMKTPPLSLSIRKSDCWFVVESKAVSGPRCAGCCEVLEVTEATGAVRLIACSAGGRQPRAGTAGACRRWLCLLAAEGLIGWEAGAAAP